jgi:hypothetical protein
MKQALRSVSVLVLTFTGCKREEVAALVNCEVKEGPTVECALKQTKGTSEIDVCFDFSVTCTNGATLEAERVCQKLQNRGARNVTVPIDKIKMSGACEGEATGAVTNMTINGKASTRT